MGELRFYGVGNATQDPELKRIGEKQISVAKTSLAFNRSFKRGEEWVKEVTFVEANVWSTKGEKFAELVKKGTPVFVEGTIRQEKWTKDDQTFTKLSLLVTDFSVIQKNINGTGDGKKEEAKKTPKKPVEQPEYSDDNLPF